MTQWISAENELPELNRVVLVRYPSGYDGAHIYAWGARLNDADGWLWGIGGRYGGIRLDNGTGDFNDIEADDDYPVTHWMHLPKPPVVDGEKVPEK